MNEAPLKNYGFEYPFEGSTFSFAVMARSREEAERMAEAMRGATFAGEMVAEPSAAPVASNATNLAQLIDVVGDDLKLAVRLVELNPGICRNELRDLVGYFRDLREQSK
jgi:hypothetical protein